MRKFLRNIVIVAMGAFYSMLIFFICSKISLALFTSEFGLIHTVALVFACLIYFSVTNFFLKKYGIIYKTALIVGAFSALFFLFIIEMNNSALVDSFHEMKEEYDDTITKQSEQLAGVQASKDDTEQELEQLVSALELKQKTLANPVKPITKESDNTPEYIYNEDDDFLDDDFNDIDFDLPELPKIEFAPLPSIKKQTNTILDLERCRKDYNSCISDIPRKVASMGLSGSASNSAARALTNDCSKKYNCQ